MKHSNSPGSPKTEAAGRPAPDFPGCFCEPLTDAEQIARLLGCSAKTVKRMAARGTLPALRIGNRWRFRPSAVDEVIRRQLLSSAPSVSEKGQA